MSRFSSRYAVAIRTLCSRYAVVTQRIKQPLILLRIRQRRPVGQAGAVCRLARTQHAPRRLTQLIYRKTSRPAGMSELDNVIPILVDDRIQVKDKKDL
jgi:hypothetical protein